MYSTAALAVALTSVASSALAAPVVSSSVLNGLGPIHIVNTLPTFDAHPVSLNARQAPATPPSSVSSAPKPLPTDASGAIDFGKIISDVGSVASTVLPFFLKREELELLARQSAPTTGTSPAPKSLPTDASGAIDFGKIISDVGSVASTVLPFFLKREELELLARQSGSTTTDASGAIDLKTIGKDALNVATTVLPFFLKREELELLARQTAPTTSTVSAPKALPTDASGAIDFGKIISDVGSVASTVLPFFLKREELELLARQSTTPPTGTTSTPKALPTDASGAIDFGKIISDVGSVASTVLPFFLKREEMELLARAAATAPTTDASGAISFGDVVKDVGSVASTVLPFFLKRAATSAPVTTDASGAISFGDVVKDVGSVASTVLPFFLKREELDLLARAVSASTPSTDASGAISFGDVVKDVGSVASTVLPFFLKREENLALLARSLNELD